MEVFRICKEAYARELMPSGVSNRWNLRGQYVIYSGSYRSLSTLELVVHRSAVIPSEKYFMMVIDLSEGEGLIQEVNVSELPGNWRLLAGYSITQEIGSKWYKSQASLILKVPSAIIPQEFNYVINTEHHEYKNQVKIVRTEDYFWDTRLL
jgi:RES domain-containing protein